MKYKLKMVLIILGCIFLVFSLAGCQNHEEVRDFRKYDEEPVINVRMEDELIEDVNIEEYIAGVVGGEMKPDWPDNAYGAQAIIARTFALQFLEDNETDTISGEFRLAQEYSPEKADEVIKEAVEMTRGEVAVYNEEYIRAWFHASAGGQTTSAKVGLAYEEEEPPYIVSVRSPDGEAPEDVQEWNAVFSEEEMLDTLIDMGEEISEIEEINIPEMDDTGRAMNLEFIDGDESVVVKAPNFRNQLDPQELKSTKITEIEKENEEFTFIGEGYGHGVGMSQWGAYSMAQEGNSPEEIVNHYFRDIEIVQVYE